MTDARRRQEVTPATEHRWWQELNQAQLALADAVNRLEAGRIRWDARLSSAMPGVEPTTWWRCYRRIEAGERWVGANASARRVQRVVYATRDRVLDLAGQRDARLAPLEAACVSAETGMRAAVRRLVAAFGIRETARRLGLPKSTVAALARSAPLTPADYRALRCVDDRPRCRTETSNPDAGETTYRRRGPMSDDSLIEDVREVAALLGRTEDRAFSAGLTADDLVGVVGEARCHLEAALLLRGEALVWTPPDSDRSAPAPR